MTTIGFIDKNCALFDMDLSNYHKYFVISKRDRAWGLHIMDCGTSHIPAGARFPSTDHPNQYLLTWEKGRVLHEYQLIYLVEGAGIFESPGSGAVSIGPGTMLLLIPEIWHRYKPDPNEVWNTFWVGFDGVLARSFIKAIGMSHEMPVKMIGYHEKIVKIFLDILETSQIEFTGYQQVMAGDVFKLLGWIYAVRKKSEFKEHDIDRIIHTAKVMLMQTNEHYSIVQVADALNMGYSKFRKLFKDYTGLSPGQFQMQHRVNKAVNLLNEDRMSIKEIASKLGFETTQYFSRLFRKKMGISPGAYRSQRIFSRTAK